ncbi:DNA mismatch repair protein MutS [Paenibacillus nanensis]|uniref:DNA mismatch repair protein MutS n=1 Tax=Paenibacillus nanensis TaxID=393251 RepID=A0A3A1UZC8_9BACL|nr:DNA mismatch repair protein MutS [Paenibacillus nanensis]RIX53615.1 DNA mismatch repair protein MutS [Paenibacillus nanensis]
MNEQTYKKLEYDRIKDMVAAYTVSPAGRRLAEAMQPSTAAGQIEAWLKETNEASELLGSGASIPLSAMEGIDTFMSLLGKGKIYTEAELDAVAIWLTSVSQMKKYMRSKMHLAPTIASYAESMDECKPLREELGRSIRYGMLTDEASPDLAYIRRQIYAMEDRISRKMENALSKYRSALQESIVSKRRDRFVIAVKRELRKQVPGTVLDESSSGQTLFVEPLDVSELQLELTEWRAAEERERTVVLARLSELAESYALSLETNRQAMASFDFIMARGKLARSYEGRLIALSGEPVIKLQGARHPLLGNNCVPIDAELGERWKQLIITGPNTGGKTAALKTMGLLALMNQSGLLIPADEGSVMGIFREVLADVGDGQSLEQSLSTFSSHIAVLKEMLTSAGPSSLLLLDEMAAGTDPSEGIALSIAVLECLLEKGSLVAATTHFNEIKTFAARTPGCQNGRMAFDPETLMPLYRLEIGEAGDSHAFAIARRFGLPESVMARAETLLAKKNSQPEPSRIAVPDVTGITLPVQPAKADSREHSAANHEKKENRPSFQKGDAVWIYPLKRAGVVYKPADERGNVIVQVKGEKLSFNQKRLKLYIARKELYPGETYDLDIVFESKANRKARHLMGRKHVEGLEIVIPEEESNS